MHARTFAKQPYGGNVEISQLGVEEMSSATEEKGREQGDDSVYRHGEGELVWVGH